MVASGAAALIASRLELSKRATSERERVLSERARARLLHSTIESAECIYRGSRDTQGTHGTRGHAFTGTVLVSEGFELSTLHFPDVTFMYHDCAVTRVRGPRIKPIATL